MRDEKVHSYKRREVFFDGDAFSFHTVGGTVAAVPLGRLIVGVLSDVPCRAWGG